MIANLKRTNEAFINHFRWKMFISSNSLPLPSATGLFCRSIITALVECMKKRAFGYIVKSVDGQRMISTLKSANKVFINHFRWKIFISPNSLPLSSNIGLFCFNTITLPDSMEKSGQQKL